MICSKLNNGNKVVYHSFLVSKVSIYHKTLQNIPSFQRNLKRIQQICKCLIKLDNVNLNSFQYLLDNYHILEIIVNLKGNFSGCMNMLRELLCDHIPFFPIITITKSKLGKITRQNHLTLNSISKLCHSQKVPQISVYERSINSSTRLSKGFLKHGSGLSPDDEFYNWNPDDDQYILNLSKSKESQKLSNLSINDQRHSNQKASFALKSSGGESIRRLFPSDYNLLKHQEETMDQKLYKSTMRKYQKEAKNIFKMNLSYDETTEGIIGTEDSNQVDSLLNIENEFKYHGGFLKSQATSEERKSLYGISVKNCSRTWISNMLERIATDRQDSTTDLYVRFPSLSNNRNLLRSDDIFYEKNDEFVSAVSSLASSFSSLTDEFEDANSNDDDKNEHNCLDYLSFLDSTEKESVDIIYKTIDLIAESCYQDTTATLKRNLIDVVSSINLFIYQYISVLFDEVLLCSSAFIAIEQMSNSNFFLEKVVSKISDEINKNAWSIFDCDANENEAQSSELAVIEAIYSKKVPISSSTPLYDLELMNNILSCNWDKLRGQINMEHFPIVCPNQFRSSKQDIASQRNWSNSFGDSNNIYNGASNFQSWLHTNSNETVVDSFVDEIASDMMKPLVMDLIVSHLNTLNDSMMIDTIVPEVQPSNSQQICQINAPDFPELDAVLDDYLNELIGPSIRFHHLIVHSRDQINLSFIKTIRTDVIEEFTEIVMKLDDIMLNIYTYFINKIYQDACCQTVRKPFKFAISRLKFDSTSMNFCEKFSRKIRSSNALQMISESDLSTVIQNVDSSHHSMTFRPNSLMQLPSVIMNMVINNGVVRVQCRNELIWNIQDFLIVITEFLDQLFLTITMDFVEKQSIEFKMRNRLLSTIFFDGSVNSDLKKDLQPFLSKVFVMQFLYALTIIDYNTGFMIQSNRNLAILNTDEISNNFLEISSRLSWILKRKLNENINLNPYIFHNSDSLAQIIPNLIQFIRSRIFGTSHVELADPDTFYTARSSSGESGQFIQVPNIEGDSLSNELDDGAQYTAESQFNSNISNSLDQSINHKLKLYKIQFAPNLVGNHHIKPASMFLNKNDLNRKVKIGINKHIMKYLNSYFHTHGIIRTNPSKIINQKNMGIIHFLFANFSLLLFSDSNQYQILVDCSIEMTTHLQMAYSTTQMSKSYLSDLIDENSNLGAKNRYTPIFTRNPIVISSCFPFNKSQNLSIKSYRKNVNLTSVLQNGLLSDPISFHNFLTHLFVTNNNILSQFKLNEMLYDSSIDFLQTSTNATVSDTYFPTSSNSSSSLNSTISSSISSKITLNYSSSILYENYENILINHSNSHAWKKVKIDNVSQTISTLFYYTALINYHSKINYPLIIHANNFSNPITSPLDSTNFPKSVNKAFKSQILPTTSNFTSNSSIDMNNEAFDSLINYFVQMISMTFCVKIDMELYLITLINEIIYRIIKDDQFANSASPISLSVPPNSNADANVTGIALSELVYYYDFRLDSFVLK